MTEPLYTPGFSPLELLRDLIALPSVNPMGRPADGPHFYESRVTDYLERLFRQIGVPYLRQRVHPYTASETPTPENPLRENIIARLEGDSAAGEVLLWEAHQDTVPVVGMTIDPFEPRVRDGRIYGRGACDVKGGMAAMLAAFCRLARDKPNGRPTIVMAAAVNEEHGFSGATAITQFWREPNPILPRQPDGAVVAEPTELDVVVAHKGVVRWRCHAHGKAAHSSLHHLGDNAIFRMARVLVALERYQRDVVANLGEHPLLGRATLSVGTIAGGISVNTVPDKTTIEIDRRLLPGEKPLDAQRHVIDFIASQTPDGAHLTHEEPFIIGFGLGDATNRPLAERLVAAARQVVPASKAVAVPYGTDAAAISRAGVPSVVFGPGSLDQAHTVDEWLSIDQLNLASDVYYRLACG